MAKKKSKKSNEQLFNVVIKTPGVEKRVGKITSVTENFVEVSYKPKRSSKFNRQLIPREKVIQIEGNEGENGFVLFLENKLPISEIKGYVEPLDGGMIIVTDKEGKTSYVNSLYADIIGADDEANANISSNRGKKSKNKDTKKKDSKKKKTKKSKKDKW